MTMDNAIAQVDGHFHKKARERKCRVKCTESHTTFPNVAESIIRQVKKLTRRKLTASGCLKRLWDDCMELESFIRSYTTLDTGQVLGQGQVKQ